MKVRRLLVMGAAALVLATAVAVPATGRPGQSSVFQANLTTDAEVHEVQGSNANGHATFTLSDDRLSFTLRANRMSGAVFGAHIHGPAGPGVNAGVVVTLCGVPPVAAAGPCSDGPGKLRVAGVITADLVGGQPNLDALVAMMESGDAYVNVHTSLNPEGEIRGQIR